MIDFIDIFDVYQQSRLAGLGSLQADTDRRITKAETGDPFQAT